MSISRTVRRTSNFDMRTARWLMVLVVAGVVSGVIAQQVTAAWQNPTCDPNVNPDTCNAAAPINVSAAAQTKNGPLTIMVATGANALTVNTGATGSPVALAVNSNGAGYGIDVANNATSGALRITSTGAVDAVKITQNKNGGTGLNVLVSGASGGIAVTGNSSTSTTGVGINGVGSDAGVRGAGAGNGTGVEAVGGGTGNGVEGSIPVGGTGSAGYFDGANSNKAITTVNGQVAMTSGIANTPTLNVTDSFGGGTGPSAITAQNEGETSPAIYGNGKNSYGISGNTQSFNFAGILGCYGSTTNCALLGSGTYAGYFNGPALVERTLQVNEISAGDTVQEMKVQGQFSDNSFSGFSIAGSTLPSAIESSGDYLWVCNRAAPLVVHKIRPSTGRIVGIVNLPIGFQCSDLAFDGQNIWASSDGATNGVTRIDIYTQIPTFFPVGAVIKGLTFDGGNLWATGYSTNQIFKINAKTGAVAATYAALGGAGPYGIVQASGSLWWVNNNLFAGKYYLSTMKTDGTGMTHYAISAEAPQRLVFDGDSVWVPSTAASAKLSKFDVVNNTERLVVNMTEAMRDITFDQNFLWVTAPTTRRLYVVRPIDGFVMSTITAYSPSGGGTLERVYFDGNAVWYSMGTDNQIGRYSVPWMDGYTNGNVYDSVSLYDAGTNTYTCVRSNGAGGIATVAGLCP